MEILEFGYIEVLKISSEKIYEKGKFKMQKSFHQKVIEIIKKIPKGKVATYGQIAILAGNAQASRQVAYILHSSSEKEKLPWHRVVNRKGGLSLKPNFGYESQKQLLEKEGIVFNRDSFIDLELFLWVPKIPKDKF